MPALGNLTWQESPTLVICASPQPESSKRPSPAGFDPSPETTGWVAPPATSKVTVPPGLTVASAGSHLFSAVPLMVTLARGGLGGGRVPGGDDQPGPEEGDGDGQREEAGQAAGDGEVHGLRCAPVGSGASSLGPRSVVRLGGGIVASGPRSGGLGKAVGRSRRW